MILYWPIEYFDRSDKTCKNRCLALDTKLLDPATRAAVELVIETKSRKTEREILKYRHLFSECAFEEHQRLHDSEPFTTVGPNRYFEDETGKEITENEIYRVVTGRATARLIPPSAKPHDIALLLAEPGPLPVAEVSLTDEEVRLLGYFVRDLREMMESAFMKQGPGRLRWFGQTALTPVTDPILETAVTDDEIRSFVMIFRRLYMTGPHDPASFSKVVPLFRKAIGNNAYGSWVKGVESEYQHQLASAPEPWPLLPRRTYSFTTKLLIDAFLYTQYAHQPNSKRQQDFEKCLAELHGKHEVLTWMFLTEIWRLSLKIGDAGRVMAQWYNQYCHYHGTTPNVLHSLRDHHLGLGSVEKDENKRTRLFEEKVRGLASVLWEQAGKPGKGPEEFLELARDNLARAMNG